MPIHESHWGDKSEHLCFIACEKGVNRLQQRLIHEKTKNPQIRLVLAHVVNNQ